MVFDISTALTWILFLAMFPIAFYWYRRAWRVLVKKDYSEVALKGGKSPKNPHKFAFIVGALNLLGGLIMTYAIFWRSGFRLALRNLVSNCWFNLVDEDYF